MSSTAWVNEHDGRIGTPRRRQVVVLAEDDEGSRLVYALILRHKGYDVIEAVDGVEAVAATRANHPDLVLMDIGLPRMDGWEAGHLLKDDPDTRLIPLIAFSARVDSTADLAHDRATFDGYILKPISPSELVRRIDAYFEMVRRPADRPVDIKPRPTDL
jgi:CheY-like chemotaxis protein